MWQEITVFIILLITIYLVINKIISIYKKPTSACEKCNLKCSDCDINKIQKHKSSKN